jgi:transposase
VPRHVVLGETCMVPRRDADVPTGQSDDEMLEIMLGLNGARVIDAVSEPEVFRAVIETRDETAACPSCGTLADEDGRRVLEQVDPLEAFGRTVVFEWHVRRWRCSSECGEQPWEETLPAVGSAQRRKGVEH